MRHHETRPYVEKRTLHTLMKVLSEDHDVEAFNALREELDMPPLDDDVETDGDTLEDAYRRMYGESQ